MYRRCYGEKRQAAKWQALLHVWRSIPKEVIICSISAIWSCQLQWSCYAWAPLAAFSSRLNGAAMSGSRYCLGWWCRDICHLGVSRPYCLFEVVVTSDAFAPCWYAFAKTARYAILGCCYRPYIGLLISYILKGDSLAFTGHIATRDDSRLWMFWLISDSIGKYNTKARLRKAR